MEDERTREETAHAANVARLEQIATDADEKAKQFSRDNRHLQATHYEGFRNGVRRAIRVLEGHG
jgi:hypothetical protein